MLEIVLYGNPVLRRRASEIEEITPEIRRLAEEMIETMISAKGVGVGLAAPQVGLSIRLFVLRDELPSTSSDDFEFGPPEVVINPQFSSPSKETESGPEGCLSIPGIQLDITRPSKIHVRYLNLEGKTIEENLEGFRARVFMHENDHLNGVLIIDRAPEKMRNKIDPVLRKIKAEFLK